MMFAVIGDSLYPKLQFLLYQAHKRGIQRIELSQPKEVNGEWTTEAKVYPYLAPSMLNKILDLPPEERKSIWEHYTKPTVEWGRASKENVANQTMWKWLPEMSRKRAAARALRLFAGIGQTAYEELPQATLTKEELESDGDGSSMINQTPMPESPKVTTDVTTEEICSCGHTKHPNHFSEGKEVICATCIRESKEVQHDLKPWR
jgi:hypothetical protein